MKALRIGAWTAVAAAVAWALKAVAIGVAGGLDQSPLEGPLFLIGLALMLTAAVCVGLALTERHGIVARVLGAVGGLVLGALLTVVIETAVGALVPESAGWVKEEAGLWVVSVVTAAALWLWLSQRRRPGPDGATPSP